LYTLGISLRSHELYILVFIARYLDLFFNYISFYNFSFKLLYIGCTAAIIYLIKFQTPIKDTYDKSLDTFPHWKLAFVPSLLIGSVIYLLGTNYHYIDPVKLMWTFSIILESVAMVPQLLIFFHCRDIARSTAVYIAFRGVYRLLYILNWIYRAHTEFYFRYNWITTVCAIIQTILYADFFGYYR
jgi:ER lumen protein retaining receptor